MSTKYNTFTELYQNIESFKVCINDDQRYNGPDSSRIQFPLDKTHLAVLRAFTVNFEKVLKSCLLLFAVLLGLIDTFCTVASLKVPTMTVYDVATKVLGTEEFPQHNITDLNSCITFIVLTSREKLLR